LRGYLSIARLWLYKQNKSVIAAQQSVPTGPVSSTRATFEDILDRIKAGLR